MATKWRFGRGSKVFFFYRSCDDILPSDSSIRFSHEREVAKSYFQCLFAARSAKMTRCELVIHFKNLLARDDSMNCAKKTIFTHWIRLWAASRVSNFDPNCGCVLFSLSFAFPFRLSNVFTCAWLIDSQQSPWVAPLHMRNKSEARMIRAQYWCVGICHMHNQEIDTLCFKESPAKTSSNINKFDENQKQSISDLWRRSGRVFDRWMGGDASI